MKIAKENTFTCLEDALSAPPESVLDLDLSAQKLSPKQLKNLHKIAVFTKLQKLNLKGLGLEEYPTELTTFPELKDLIISDNQLKTLPSDICHLKKLKSFWASNNPFESLPSDLFRINLIRMGFDKKKLVRSTEELLEALPKQRMKNPEQSAPMPSDSHVPQLGGLSRHDYIQTLCDWIQDKIRTMLSVHSGRDKESIARMDVKPTVRCYIEKTFDVAEMKQGPFRLWGIQTAMQNIRNCQELFGVDRFGNEPLLVIPIGDDSVGMSYWLDLLGGKTIALHHEDAFFEAGLNARGASDLYHFHLIFLSQSSFVDFHQLLFLQTEFAKVGFDTPERVFNKRPTVKQRRELLAAACIALSTVPKDLKNYAKHYPKAHFLMPYIVR